MNQTMPRAQVRNMSISTGTHPDEGVDQKQEAQEDLKSSTGSYRCDYHDKSGC
jgi:hypothetical protein